MSARLKAFFLHLGGSAVIALLTLVLVFQLWYPAPLHEAVGVTRIFLLLLLVDVMLGPLLTLLVFKVGKNTLAFDLGVVLLLQLGALGYGLWTVAEGRPAWLVFNADRFDLVRTLDVDRRQLSEAREEYRMAPWFGPEWVGAAKPVDMAQQNAILFESLMARIDIAQRPNLYRPLADMGDDLRQKLRPLESLANYNDEQQLRAILNRWPNADAWLPLMASAKPMTVLLRKDTAEVIAIVELNPWD